MEMKDLLSGAKRDPLKLVEKLMKMQKKGLFKATPGSIQNIIIVLDSSYKDDEEEEAMRQRGRSRSLPPRIKASNGFQI